MRWFYTVGWISIIQMIHWAANCRLPIVYNTYVCMSVCLCVCVWINEWKSTLHLPKLFFYSFFASCSTQHTIVMLYKFSNNEISYYRRDVCISGIIFFFISSVCLYSAYFFFLLFTSFNELKMRRKKTCLNQFWMSHSYRSPFSKLRSLYWWIVSHQFKLIYKHVHIIASKFFFF